MQYMDWFVWTMKKTFNIEISIEDVSYQVYTFDHEDLEGLFIPQAHLEKLPKSFLFETLSYVDHKDNRWIAGVVLEEETGKKLYELWIRDNEPIAYELYVE
jgi:hypothetical protein